MKDFILKGQRESNENLPENSYLKKKKKIAAEREEKRRVLEDPFNESDENVVLVGFDNELNAICQESDDETVNHYGSREIDFD